MTFSSSVSNVVVWASMLSWGVDKDAVSSFSFFLPILILSLLSSPRKITFSSDLHFCHMVVTDERLQARRLLIFFSEFFLKDVFGRKFLFPWGRNGDAKVVFFLAGSFSRNREVFKSDGLIRRIFIIFDYRCFRRRSWYLKLYEEQSSCPFFDVWKSLRSLLFSLKLRCRYL